jgi:hypothetical protein
VEQAHQRWGHPRLLPRYDAALGALAGGHPPRTGLLFSGGVDSFHALLASGRHIDDLVFVQGFDIPLTDGCRAASYERIVREVAEATETRAIRVRTNLGTHPVFQRLPWARARLGALAAVGHVLTDHISAALIASSAPTNVRAARKSGRARDQDWSSASLRVEHVGDEFTRDWKLSAIARDPLARQHLRVCREYRSPGLNCSRCEKCLRTQLELLAEHQLSHYRVFESDVTLAERLDRLERIVDPFLVPVYARAVAGSVPPDVSLALSRLLARSRLAHRQLRRRVWLGRVGSAARRIWRVSQPASGRPA